MYKIEKDNSDFMVFLKTELNKLEKDYGADYTDAIFNIIIELVYKHNIKSINYTDILNKINRLINNYPITSINLDNENNKCIYIAKDEINNKWYYNRAYKIIVDKLYKKHLYLSTVFVKCIFHRN